MSDAPYIFLNLPILPFLLLPSQLGAPPMPPTRLVLARSGGDFFVGMFFLDLIFELVFVSF